MSNVYEHLGIYSDLVNAAPAMWPEPPLARPGRATQKRILEVMNFSIGEEIPQGPRVERRWEKDGLQPQRRSLHPVHPAPPPFAGRNHVQLALLVDGATPLFGVARRWLHEAGI